MIAGDEASRFDWEAAKERLRAAEESISRSDQLSPAQANQLLRRRADELARADGEEVNSEDVLHVVRFRLGDENIAVAADCVLELLVLESVTPIPQAPPHFIGITNLRGHVTAIVDLCVLLEIPRENRVRRQALILGREETEFGIAVDGIDHVTTLHRSELVGSAMTAHQDLIKGLTADGLLVLDGQGLLDCPALYIDEID
jgi:purine-binding chemotaxis protein CheW